MCHKASRSAAPSRPLHAGAGARSGGARAPLPPTAPPPRVRPRARRPRRGLVRALARRGADDGWYDAPATANFVDVRSEDELRHVMRTCYGNERASTLLVVEFYARWCNSCRRLYPRLCKLAAQEQDVLFVKIDFDACKDLCRALGVHKLPYFHLYNGSGARLADFSASLDPAKFQRLTDAIDANRALRCAVNPAASVADAALASVADAEPAEPAASAETRTRITKSASPALVKLHRVTFVWRGGGEDVMLAGDVAGGWTHQIAMTRVDSDDARADARGQRSPPTNGPRFVDARDDGSARVPPPLDSPATHARVRPADRDVPVQVHRRRRGASPARTPPSPARTATSTTARRRRRALAVRVGEGARFRRVPVRRPRESSDGDYPGPPGRANDCVPVAIESRAASEEELRRERAEAARASGTRSGVAAGPGRVQVVVRERGIERRGSGRRVLLLRAGGAGVARGGEGGGGGGEAAESVLRSRLPPPALEGGGPSEGGGADEDERGGGFRFRRFVSRGFRGRGGESGESGESVECVGVAQENIRGGTRVLLDEERARASDRGRDGAGVSRAQVPARGGGEATETSKRRGGRRDRFARGR